MPGPVVTRCVMSDQAKPKTWGHLFLVSPIAAAVMIGAVSGAWSLGCIAAVVVFSSMNNSFWRIIYIAICAAAVSVSGHGLSQTLASAEVMATPWISVVTQGSVALIAGAVFYALVFWVALDTRR